jgi:tRNA-2-methylthio-N6-dimethylallyladenosine synthase
MNAYDSGRLGDLLRFEGWAEAAALEDADFIFLNTCSIREKAEKRVIARLRSILPLKKGKPSLVVGVGGCVAEQEGRALLGLFPQLDIVAGPRRISEIPSLLRPNSDRQFPVVLSGDAQEGGPGDVPGLPPVPPRVLRQTGPTAFLTIMEGCDNHCAYCVVPRLRGPERSRDPADVLREAAGLVARGAVEITLLGQNVNSYRPRGSDGMGPGIPFVRLIKAMASALDVRRLRFTTSHPRDFPPELTRLFAEESVLAPHVHLPLQSGSDRTLWAMGRGYSYKEYLAVLKGLREANEGIAVSTDIIVGFPGESEEDFDLTLKAMEEIRFDSAFCFRYSDRPGTRAQAMPWKVPEADKASRLQRLIALQKEIGAGINRGLLGTVQEVLVEGRGREPGQLSGRTGGNKIVNFQGPDRYLGDFASVRILRTGPVSLLGGLPGGREGA